MTSEYRIDAEAGAVYSKFSGKIGAADVQNHRNRILGDPLYRPGLVHLFDACSAQFKGNGEESRKSANWYEANRPFSKVAIVIGPENRGFLRRYLGWLQEEAETEKFFEEMGSAREFLGLQPEEG